MKSNKQIIEKAMDEIRSFGRDVDNEDFRNIIESALKQQAKEIAEECNEFKHNIKTIKAWILAKFTGEK